MLTFHHKTLQIQENIQCNPLNCEVTYTNLGGPYLEMKNYMTALTYFQQGVYIRQEKLSNKHSDFSVIYRNLSKLYLVTQQYNLAMKNIQTTFRIAENSLPTRHPLLVEYRETFEKYVIMFPVCLRIFE